MLRRIVQIWAILALIAFPFHATSPKDAVIRVGIELVTLLLVLVYNRYSKKSGEKS